jgi:hypothetical protein
MQHRLSVCHLLWSKIPPVVLAATYSNMHSFIGLSLLVRGNIFVIFCNPTIPHVPRHIFENICFHLYIFGPVTFINSASRSEFLYNGGGYRFRLLVYNKISRKKAKRNKQGIHVHLSVVYLRPNIRAYNTGHTVLKFCTEDFPGTCR